MICSSDSICGFVVSPDEVLWSQAVKPLVNNVLRCKKHSEEEKITEMGKDGASPVKVK